MKLDTREKTSEQEVCDETHAGEKYRRFVCPEVSYPTSCSIIFIISLLCYYTSLDGTFVFDDAEAIVNNEDVKGNHHLRQLFYNDFWGTALTHKSSHKSYRPLTVLSFRLNYLLGGLDPKPYHIVNLFLHSICSVLSLIVFTIIFREKRPRLSFASAVIFSIHPVHTEAVAGIVGRADLLCGVFYFLSIYTYASYINSGSSGYFAVSMASCAIAMLCKELGITVLGVLGVYDLVVTTGSIDLRHIVKRSILKRYCVMVIVGLVLLYYRFTVMGSSPPAFQRVDNPASFSDSVLTRILSYNYIYLVHALLLVWPHWLCFDWSMGCIPLLEKLTDVRNGATLFFWLLLLSTAIRALCSSSSRDRRLLILGLALLIIPFLPATNVFFRVGFVVAERVLFLPVAGYCLLVVYGLEKLNLLYRNFKFWRSCFLAILILYWLKSYRRTLDWHDEGRLFSAGLNVCPLNAKVHYNIGKNAADRGLHQEAIARYETALELNPNYDQAMNNLANLLKDSGKLGEAEQLLKKAIKVRPDFAAAWMNLGIVQALLKKHVLARNSYLTALAHRRKYPDCYYNLGNLYLELERFSDAEEAFRNATALHPGHVLAWTNLIVMLENTGQSTRSETTAIEALKILPNEANLHFSLAGILGKQSRFDESEHHFQAAIKLNPRSPIYHTNLGVLYHRWKKYDLAEQSYRRALQLNPSWKSAVDNLKLLHKTIIK